MIDRIKRKVEFFLNTELRGNFTPGKFELALNDAIQGRNEEYFYDLNRLIVRENRGMITGGLANISDTYSEKILHYLEESDPIEVVDSKITLPEHWRYIDESELVDGATLEFCKNKREFNIQKTFATKQYPVYTIIGNGMLIYPVKNGSKITLSYLRKTKYPKWTYTVIDGVELFNPDADDFQDADIHSSEEDEMVRRVLLAFGVHLKAQDIQAFAMQEDSKDFNQDNAS
jgi:hypothetical protein